MRVDRHTWRPGAHFATPFTGRNTCLARRTGHEHHDPQRPQPTASVSDRSALPGGCGRCVDEAHPGHPHEGAERHTTRLADDSGRGLHGQWAPVMRAHCSVHTVWSRCASPSAAVPARLASGLQAFANQPGQSLLPILAASGHAGSSSMLQRRCSASSVADEPVWPRAVDLPLVPHYCTPPQLFCATLFCATPQFVPALRPRCCYGRILLASPLGLISS